MSQLLEIPVMLNQNGRKAILSLPSDLSATEAQRIVAVVEAFALPADEVIAGGERT